MNLYYLPIALLFTLSACALASAQTCQSETAIPSTTPTSRFLVHGDNTVTDTATGLMWARCPEGLGGSDCTDGAAKRFTWEEALSRARDSTLAGYTDWRLPTVKELSFIVEERCTAPAINLAVFPNSSQWMFWSASPSYYIGRSWIVSFSSAQIFDGYRSMGYNVRLVRPGQ